MAAEPSGEFITIARIAKPQGRIGEVAADVLTDFVERFEDRRRVFALAEDGSRRELQLEDFWPHKQRIVLKFAGVESISDAEALVGCEIQIPAAERSALEADTHYVADLAGCKVYARTVASGDPKLIGEVRDVQFGAGEAPLLVIGEGKNEILLPLAAEYVKQIDTAAKRIDLNLPEGMLEMNAPLTAEEKKQQSGT